MLKLNDKEVTINHFPDGTILLKGRPQKRIHEFMFMAMNELGVKITWHYENNEELVALIFLVGHLRQNGIDEINLYMPYIPNARQDRVKSNEDVFTLKYFANIINYLNFKSVHVLDPHSHVSEALIDRVVVHTPKKLIDTVIKGLTDYGAVKNLTMFYPDEGAMKRYSSMFAVPYAFGIKERNWEDGKIIGMSVSGMTDKIRDNRVLIVDDICSKGGTFYHSAKKLKELGASEIFLFVTHCENTVLYGDLINSGLIDRIYTTNSIFTKSHELIEVLNYEN